MPTTAEISRILDGLSDYEREHFLKLLGDASAGERFWEAGVATAYNQYVKTRSNSDLASASFDPSAAEGIFAPIPITKSYSGAARVVLPAPGAAASSLDALLQSRRSRRGVSRTPLTQEALSTLLHHAGGVTGSTAGYGYERLPLRSFPTCGGLQSPEIYLSVQAAADIAPGLYHYQAQQHALELMREGSCGPAMSKIALELEFVEKAAAVLIVTGSFERLRWKYGERAYRYMCVDVGCLTQNIYLVGEALGLAVCAIAGFVDEAVEHLLGVDGEDELALLLIAIGAPAAKNGAVSHER
jgi:SagB-type dehydrogenase family enzyme